MTLRQTSTPRRALLQSLAVITALLAGCPTTVGADITSSSFISFRQQIEPPRGFSAMCQHKPALCGPADPLGQAEAHVGLVDNLHLLDHVNRTVNRVVRQADDWRVYGQNEVWTPAGLKRGARGDCEDIALEKRQQLIHAGVPADNLFLAVGYARRLGLHVVLVARTSGGDLVLDSRSNELRSWRSVPYSWIGAQSGQDPAQWYAIRQPA